MRNIPREMNGKSEWLEIRSREKIREIANVIRTSIWGNKVKETYKEAGDVKYFSAMTQAGYEIGRIM